MAGEDIVRFIMKRFLDMSKDDAIMAAQVIIMINTKYIYIYKFDIEI